MIYFVLEKKNNTKYPRQTSSLLYPVQSKRIRTQEKIITDCMTVWSEEGHLYYKSTTSDPSVCGIYIVAKPEQTVHVYFDYVDVPCNTGGLIALLPIHDCNPTITSVRIQLIILFYEISIISTSQTSELQSPRNYVVENLKNPFKIIIIIHNTSKCSVDLQFMLNMLGRKLDIIVYSLTKKLSSHSKTFLVQQPLHNLSNPLIFLI
ncbi:hypothetical protein QTP88_012531 [Uroleucon formosanum]